MPTWDEILNETQRFNPLYLVEKYTEDLANHTGNTVFCYISAFTTLKKSAPSILHSIVESDMQGFMTCAKGVDKTNLDLILHTPGGDLEATKKIISYLRMIFKRIRVFVPLSAMSGGTLISCSADEIFMGPYSHLGPTDPQILLSQAYVPIGAIIKEFDQAKKEVIENPRTAAIWFERLKAIPFGVYQSIKNMHDHINKDTKELLEEFMLKNDPQKEAKSSKIADFLSNYSHHSSHAKGINLTKAKELGLEVKNLAEDKKLEDAVLSIFHATTILFQQSTIQKIIINNKKKKYIVNHSP